MANSTFTKLMALGTAVASIGAVTFEFTPYSSQNSLIKQGVDSLKAMVQGKDAALKQLQAEYDEIMQNLNSTQDALQQARIKLQAIYQKITGNEWDEATQGDILDFDFNSLVKDGDQFENNVDGDAICDVLGLPHGSSTQQIIAKIEELIATVQSLEEQVERLEAQVQSLQQEIETYKAEESQLVLDLEAQIADLKARAEGEANAIIEQANTEEQEQLDYINGAIEELENPQAEVPEQGEGEEQEPVEPEQQAQAITFTVNNIGNIPEKNRVNNGLNNLGIKAVTDNPNLTLTASSSSANVYKIKISDEAIYNAMISHEMYNETNHGFFINEDNQPVAMKPAIGDWSLVVIQQ